MCIRVKALLHYCIFYNTFVTRLIKIFLGYTFCRIKEIITSIYFWNFWKVDFPTPYVFGVRADASTETCTYTILYQFLNRSKSELDCTNFFENICYAWNLVFHYFLLRDMFKIRTRVNQSKNILYMLSYFLVFTFILVDYISDLNIVDPLWIFWKDAKHLFRKFYWFCKCIFLIYHGFESNMFAQSLNYLTQILPSFGFYDYSSY